MVITAQGEQADISQPSYTPFPVDCLPTVAATFVQQCSSVFGCDPALFALPTLVVMAGAIGNSRLIQLKSTWQEPAILWGTIVSNSGTMKTPAARAAMKPLEDIHQQWLMPRLDEDRSPKQEQSTQSSTDKTMPVLSPPQDRLMCNDVSLAALAVLLAQNPKGLILYRDELAGWLSPLVQNGEKANKERSLWLQVYQGEPLTVDRKSRGTIHVLRGSVSVLGTIQPATLSRLMTTACQESGLSARLLMAMPPTIKKKWTDKEITLKAQSDYRGLIEHLAHLPVDLEPPVSLELTKPARKVWGRFYDQWAEKQDEATPRKLALLAKLEGIAARLALIHHVATQVQGLKKNQQLNHSRLRAGIGKDSINNGVAMVEWFARERERIEHEIGSSPEISPVRQLQAWILKRGGAVTTRELIRARPGTYRTASDAKQALDDLVERKLGLWETVPSTSKGGRPTERFVLLT